MIGPSPTSSVLALSPIGGAFHITHKARLIITLSWLMKRTLSIFPTVMEMPELI